MKPCTVAYSFHNLRSWDYLYKWNEQQEKPHAICIYQQPDVPKVAIGVWVHQWLWHNEGCTYDTTKGHSPLPCFWLVHLKFSQDFRLPKPSVVNAFQYVLSPTRHIRKGWWREWRVRRYNLILNYKWSSRKTLFYSLNCRLDFIFSLLPLHEKS